MWYYLLCGLKNKSPVSDANSSSESDSENSKKPELQKTRSRTEKQKQQDTDSPSSKENGKTTVLKKKTPLLKRTRSGSLKPESNEPPKKRKYTKSDKSNKGSTVAGNIRHTIKTFVSRKRSNRIRDLSKDSKPESSDLPSNDEAADAVDGNVISDQETEEARTETTVVLGKKLASESVNVAKAKPSEEPSADDSEEKLMILEIPPLNAEKIASLETDPTFGEADSKLGTDSDTSSINISPPVLKKEVLTFDEMNNIRIGSNQSLAISYLAENLDAKPKLVKSGGAKVKKEGDEPKMSPSKLFSRSPNEKSASKTAAGDAKEKTFFPSRAATPTADKNEKTVGCAKKFDLGDAKDKKETKIRSVTTLTSYLNMDKIDSIKKVSTTPEKSSPDKSGGEKSAAPAASPLAAAKATAEFSAFSGEDDVYEFKEPEPLEFRGIDDRTILHRRSVSRIFEDGNAKRAKTSPTASDTVIKESEDGKSGEEISLEVKPIPQSPAKDDVWSGSDLSRCEKVIVETASTSAKSNDGGSSSGIVFKVESKELVAKSSGELVEIAFAQPLQIVAETIVGSIDEDTLQVAESLSVAPLIESLDEDDVDADEAKLVILDDSVSGASAILTDDLVETVTSSTAGDVQNSVADCSQKKAPSRLVVVGDHDAEVLCAKSSATAEKIPGSAESEAVAAHCGENVADGSSNVIEGVGKFKNTLTCSPPAPHQDLAVKTSTAVPDSTASSPPSESKSSTYVKSEDSVNEDDVENESSSFDEAARSSTGFVQRADSIINEVEIEAEPTGASDVKNEKTPLSWRDEKVAVANSTNDYVKAKPRCDDDDMNNDSLLCEETIPKSPESKEPAANETSAAYACGSRQQSGDSSKSPMHENLPTKSKKRGRSSNYSATSENAVFENTPPTTPEEGGSTPATSPSE